MSLLVFKKQDSLGSRQSIQLDMSFGITQWVAVLIIVKEFRKILLSLILSYRSLETRNMESNKYAIMLVFVNHAWAITITMPIAIYSICRSFISSNMLATSVSVRTRKMVNYACVGWSRKKFMLDVRNDIDVQIVR